MTRRRRQRRDGGGTTLLVLLVLIVALAAMGAVAVRAATTDTAMAGAERRARVAFYCAEAGLNAGRGYFAANVLSWNALFAGQNLPPGYPVTGDLDGDGVPDYSVTLKDNLDEFAPNPNNPLVDSDLSAIMVSRCIARTLPARALEEVVIYNGRGTDYRAQLGHGSRHTGNEN